MLTLLLILRGIVKIMEEEINEISANVANKVKKLINITITVVIEP